MSEARRRAGGAARGDPDPGRDEPREPREPRPIVERIGLAAIAIVIGGLFAIVAAASFVSGELFLAAMGALGAAMTVWAGLLTLVRG
jgi:hypothetical protein